MGMAIKTIPKTAKVFDKHRLEMIELARKVNEQAGIVGEPTMTPEEIQEYERALGVRPEDNSGSREILRMRYDDDRE
jgi:hypothetical protein